MGQFSCVDPFNIIKFSGLACEAFRYSANRGNRAFQAKRLASEDAKQARYYSSASCPLDEPVIMPASFFKP